MKVKHNAFKESDPRLHAVNLQRMLGGLITHCREDAAKIAEPRAQALCEATAEVLIGLGSLWKHYESRAEPAVTA